MKSVETRLAKLENDADPNAGKKEFRGVVAMYPETCEEAYEKKYGEPFTEDAEEKYSLSLIQFIPVRADGTGAIGFGCPSPN